MHSAFLLLLVVGGKGPPVSKVDWVSVELKSPPSMILLLPIWAKVVLRLHIAALVPSRSLGK